MFGLGFIEILWQDVRYGARMLGRNPGFTLVAALSFALGIGANSTIFSALDASLLRPTPYRDAESLVFLFGTNIARGQTRGWVATADFLDWQERNRAFEHLGLAGDGTSKSTLNDSGPPEKVAFQHVTPDLFELLGVKAAIGRGFDAAEVRRSVNTLVLSYEFWQRRYGGDAGVIGRKVTLGGRPGTIVGVMPAGFQILSGGSGTDIWEALNLGAPGAANRKIPWLVGVGRLKPEASLSEAQAEMSAIAGQLEQAYPDTNKGRGIRLQLVTEALRAGPKSVLYPLFGVTGFVLLIACANVAGLLLSRSASRKKEMAMRAAVGAGRGRLVRQLLTEGVLLAALGGLLGVGVAYAGIRIFDALTPGWFSAHHLTLNTAVLAFTFLVSVLVGVLVALAPALHAARHDLNDAIKKNVQAVGRGAGNSARKALVVSEVALALILLVGAGLMIRSFLKVVSMDSGFDPHGLLTMHVDLSGPSYSEPAAVRDIDITRFHPRLQLFYDSVLENARALPGVESAALVSWLPMGRGTVGPRQRPFLIAGQPAPPPAEMPTALYNMVSPDYFRVMRIPLRRGRYLTERDTVQAPWAVVINESMARQFWPGEDPIGKTLTIATIQEELPRTVVGIAGDVRQFSLASKERPEMYTSFDQQPALYGDGAQNRRHRILVLRTNVKPEGLSAAVREHVRRLDPSQPVYDPRTMEQVLADSASPWRFYMMLLGIFAGVALLLASVGLHGLIAYSVQERTHEIGIRIAVGAGQSQVLRMVIRQGMLLVLIGLALGLAGSMALTRLMAAAPLFDVQPTDPVTLAGVSALLAAVSLGAVFWPAYKASRIDPLHALRSE
ncbi:MAG: ABC transporter permease [Bryobacteraceae bacterium]